MPHITKLFSFCCLRVLSFACIVSENNILMCWIAYWLGKCMFWRYFNIIPKVKMHMILWAQVCLCMQHEFNARSWNHFSLSFISGEGGFHLANFLCKLRPESNIICIKIKLQKPSTTSVLEQRIFSVRKSPLLLICLVIILLLFKTCSCLWCYLQRLKDDCLLGY